MPLTSCLERVHCALTGLAHSRARLLSLNSQSKPARRNERAPADTSLGLALYRDVAGKQQGILVMADADFMSTAELAASVQSIHQSFLEGVMRWMSNGAYPVDTTRPAPIDTKTALDLRDVDRVKIVLFGVIPLVVFCCGDGLFIHRRRR